MRVRRAQASSSVSPGSRRRQRIETASRQAPSGRDGPSAPLPKRFPARLARISGPCNDPYTVLRSTIAISTADCPRDETLSGGARRASSRSLDRSAQQRQQAAAGRGPQQVDDRHQESERRSGAKAEEGDGDGLEVLHRENDGGGREQDDHG